MNFTGWMVPFWSQRWCLQYRTGSSGGIFVLILIQQKWSDKHEIIEAHAWHTGNNLVIDSYYHHYTWYTLLSYVLIPFLGACAWLSFELSAVVFWLWATYVVTACTYLVIGIQWKDLRLCLGSISYLGTIVNCFYQNVWS